VTDRRHRKVVVGCALALVVLIVFGVYAITQGPPPKSEAVVYFDPAATDEQKQAVRAACPTVGKAVQLPPDSGDLAISRVYPLRYDMSRASSQDEAALYHCVNAQPGVMGIRTTTQGQ
jgi:hypothetical protein